MKKIDYSGSWALVTGASSGLGAEFARQLAHRGANLVLTARSRERLLNLAEDLSNINGVATRVVVADLGTDDGVRALLDGVDALGMPIQHVVSNAGVGAAGAFASLDAESQERMLHVNVLAVTAIARHFVPRLLAQAAGGIIHVASTAAYQPTPFMTTYGASKAFVLSFSAALSEELRGSGVRVLALCPGPVPTGFQEAAGIQQVPLMKLARVEPRQVVECALSGYDAGRTVVVPGAMNSVQTVASKLLPRSVITRAARWTMKSLKRA